MYLYLVNLLLLCIFIDMFIMKDIRNVIKWTALDEQLHFNMGVMIINILRKEHPELFDEELSDIIKKACIKSVKYEKYFRLDFRRRRIRNLWSKKDLLNYMERSKRFYDFYGV